MNNLLYTTEFIPTINVFGLHDRRRLDSQESIIYQNIITELNYVLEHFRNEYFAIGGPSKGLGSINKTLFELTLYLLASEGSLFEKHCTSDKISFYVVLSVEEAFKDLKQIILRSEENYDDFLLRRMKYYDEQYKKIVMTINEFGRTSDEAYRAFYEILDLIVEQPLTSIRTKSINSNLEFTLPVAKPESTGTVLFAGFMIKVLFAWRGRLNGCFKVEK